MVDCVTMLSYDDNVPTWSMMISLKQNYATEFFASIKDVSSLSMVECYLLYIHCDDIFVIYRYVMIYMRMLLFSRH